MFMQNDSLSSSRTTIYHNVPTTVLLQDDYQKHYITQDDIVSYCIRQDDSNDLLSFHHQATLSHYNSTQTFPENIHLGHDRGTIIISNYSQFVTIFWQVFHPSPCTFNRDMTKPLTFCALKVKVYLFCYFEIQEITIADLSN